MARWKVIEQKLKSYGKDITFPMQPLFWNIMDIHNIIWVRPADLVSDL